MSHEIRRWPAGADDYVARVSIADIAAPGPFTALPGYRRWLAVLDDGGGLALTIGARTWRGARGASIEFDGGEAASATLVRPARVWNLIARDGLAWTAAWHDTPGVHVLPAGWVVVHALATNLTTILTTDDASQISVDDGGAIVIHMPRTC